MPVPPGCFALLVDCATSLAQCPMCKQALEGDQAAGGGDGLARGFANSIYFMVALPYLLLGTGVFAVWRMTRKQKLLDSEP